MPFVAYNKLSAADDRITNYNRLRCCNFKIDFNFSKTLSRVAQWTYSFISISESDHIFYKLYVYGFVEISAAPLLWTG